MFYYGHILVIITVTNQNEALFARSKTLFKFYNLSKNCTFRRTILIFINYSKRICVNYPDLFEKKLLYKSLPLQTVEKVTTNRGMFYLVYNRYKTKLRRMTSK